MIASRTCISGTRPLRSLLAGRFDQPFEGALIARRRIQKRVPKYADGLLAQGLVDAKLFDQFALLFQQGLRLRRGVATGVRKVCKLFLQTFQKIGLLLQLGKTLLDGILGFLPMLRVLSRFTDQCLELLRDCLLFGQGGPHRSQFCLGLFQLPFKVIPLMVQAVADRWPVKTLAKPGQNFRAYRSIVYGCRLFELILQSRWNPEFELGVALLRTSHGDLQHTKFGVYGPIRALTLEGPSRYKEPIRFTVNGA